MSKDTRPVFTTGIKDDDSPTGNQETSMDTSEVKDVKPIILGNGAALDMDKISKMSSMISDDTLKSLSSFIKTEPTYTASSCSNAPRGVPPSPYYNSPLAYGPSTSTYVSRSSVYDPIPEILTQYGETSAQLKIMRRDYKAVVDKMQSLTGDLLGYQAKLKMHKVLGDTRKDLEAKLQLKEIHLNKLYEDMCRNCGVPLPDVYLDHPSGDNQPTGSNGTSKR